jgi:hypothetical protein
MTVEGGSAEMTSSEDNIVESVVDFFMVIDKRVV